MAEDETLQGRLAALERERDALRLILDALPAFVFYKDTRNRILRVNRAVADSLGVQAAEMADTETRYWYPDEAEQYHRDDLEVIAARRPKLGIIEELETGSGEKRAVQTDKFPQFDDDGNVAGIVVIAQDITERLRLERELAEAQRLDGIARLAGGIAHDFNNLLTAILGHVELARLQLGKQSPVATSLDAIRLAAERSAELTRQLLAFARRQVRQPRVVDLNVVVGDMGQLLVRALGEDIALKIRCAPDVVPVLIDPGQITEVLLTMALNARDVMPGGGVLTIETEARELAPAKAGPAGLSGPVSAVVVSDTGPGLSEQERAHLFEPFFTTKELGRGGGLGLASVHGIVKQNGGEIEVESGAGRGTRFRILLPRAREPVAIGPAQQLRPHRREGGETILLVEDDQALRALALAVLSDSGFRVLTAENGREALEIAETHRDAIDLVIADVVMPRLGGPEVVRELRAGRPDLPAVFMSGYAESRLVQDGVLGEGVTLLSKPFTPKQLLEAVRALLGGHP